MKKSFMASVCGLIIMGLAGCTPVKFFSDQQLTQRCGFKYYTTKPYFQVERDLATGSVVKATVIYLPDLANPQYVVIKAVPGSGKVDLKLTDGSITTIGVATDMKLGETVDAMAALIANGASAVTALKGAPSAAGASAVTELYEILMDKEGTSLKKIEIR
jgi:uncharacterized protein involved in tellurium resistance